VKRNNLNALIKCLVLLFMPMACFAQVSAPNANTNYYLIHSSSNVIAANVDGRTIIKAVTGGNGQLLQFVPDGGGYYWVKPAGQKKYMALSGGWDTYFVTDSTTDASKFAIEKVNNSVVKLRCKSNSKYLGTDSGSAGSYVYSDKTGTESNHYWFISEKVVLFPVDTFKTLINPADGYSKPFEGWGVSLCWWANMCGKWSDAKIDELVDWLVSPTGLNYRIFRYNIGGGDDPLNRHCTLHHMAGGKGLRAEMEGFKDSLNAPYDWSRDAAQRKIMLKIREKRPDAIFEAFSNSCPYYMTYSGCCAGNVVATDDNLKPEYYDDFAHYLVDVCKFYKDSFNLEFKTLAPFNEPVTSYWKANGEQEGCHFATANQIAFLKVLSPILKQSGLKTIISSSDETSIVQSWTDLKAYIADGTAINLIGQWNTHTYGGTDEARAALRALSTAQNKTLWMSEVGSGGSGIDGNLSLAQKLMDDIRFIRPEAWVDWQYMEEGNDQWCLVKGSFSAQTYQRVKNYYVRQQVSRYILPESRFLSVFNKQMLAALSPDSKTLTLVVMNSSDLKVNQQIDLSMFDQLGNISATRTSETENNAGITDFSLQNSSLSATLPSRSITTFVIPVTLAAPLSSELKTDVPYLIISRAANLVLQSSGNNAVINNYQYADSTQLWKLAASGDGYAIKNLAGKTLTDAGSYYVVPSPSSGISGQTFGITTIGDNYYKIFSATAAANALDLEGAKYTAGTKVGLYNYGTSPDAINRQWMFVLAPGYQTNATPNGVKPVSIATDAVRVVGANGAILVFQVPESTAQVSVYTITGEKVLEQKLSSTYAQIPIRPGAYIVNCRVGKDGKSVSLKVLVD